MSKTETETKKVSPKVVLISKWKLEEECFKNAKIKDLKTGKESSWPFIKTTDQIAYETFLDNVVDPDTGYYFPTRDGEGKPVKTDPNPKYVVNTIMRLRTKDNSEFLLSKGYLVGYDALGDKVTRFISMPEKWMKTTFQYVKIWNDKRKTIEKNCTGPENTEYVYTLEFNEKNLKELFNKRENDNTLNWVLKDELGEHPKSLAAEPNINDTFKLFLKPFDFLYNGQYISPELRAQYRQEAIDAGILAAPATATATQTRAPPSTGTYS